MPSLAGLGTGGRWTVEIDSEDVDSAFEWGVTLSHPQVHYQSALPNLATLEQLVAHLTDGELHDRMFRINSVDGLEMLAGVVEEQLLLRIVRIDTASNGSSWLLECALPMDEAIDLSSAIGEAIRNARLPYS